MTDEEREALRAEIEGLTIRDARARAETATETLRILSELGLVRPAQVLDHRQALNTSPERMRGQTPQPSVSPYPCLGCGRTAVEKPGEPASPIECQLCGNHLPLPAGVEGARVSNKGPLVMDPEMLARRQALIAQPAFDENGEPT